MSSTNENNNTSLTKIVAIIGFIALVGGGLNDWWGVFDRFKTPSVPLLKATPIFSENDTTFKVLVLPFKMRGCSGKESIGPTISDRLKTINSKDTLLLNVHYLDIEMTNNFSEDSVKIIQQFNNADLIIYGNYTRNDCNSSNEDNVSINYILSESWSLDSLQSNTRKGVYQKTSLNDIVQGKLQGNIDLIVYLCAGIREYNKTNYAKALRKFRAAEALKLNNYTLNEYIGTCNYYMYNSEAALRYLNGCVNTAISLNDSSKLEHCYIFLGHVYNNKKQDKIYNLDKALSYYFKCIDIAEKTNEEEGSLGMKYYYLSKVFVKKKDFQKAILYFRKAIENLETDPTAYDQTIVDSFNKIGECYYYDDNVKASIPFYKKALSIYDILYLKNDKLFDIYTSLSACYRSLRDYENCFYYDSRQLDAINKLPQTYNIKSYLATYYLMKGSRHYYFEEYEKSKLSLYTAYAYSTDSTQLPDIYIRLAFAYQGLQDLPTAWHYAQKAKKVYEKTKKQDNVDMSFLYYVLGCIYNKKKEYKQAISAYQKAIEYTSKVKYFPKIRYQTIYHGLAQSYFNISDFQNAKKYVEQAIEIRASLFDDNHPDLQESLALYQQILCK